MGAGAHYRGWLYGLCAEKPPGAVLLLGGVYAVLVSLGRYVWVWVNMVVTQTSRGPCDALVRRILKCFTGLM